MEKIMKSALLRVVMCLMAIACLPSLSALAQTTASSASTRYESDQVLRDLLNEVRQLRADLLRLNINAHRTQTLLDRKKMQQEQVLRLTRDLDNARNELSAIRSRQARTKEEIEVQEKRRAVGVVGDDEIRAMT